jgi:gliding motility-associated-like protein
MLAVNVQGQRSPLRKAELLPPFNHHTYEYIEDSVPCLGAPYTYTVTGFDGSSVQLVLIDPITGKDTVYNQPRYYPNEDGTAYYIFDLTYNSKGYKEIAVLETSLGLCTNDSIFYKVKVTELELFEGDKSVFCAGDTLSRDVFDWDKSSPSIISYEWINTTTSDTLSGSAVKASQWGNYHIVARNAQGCKGFADLTVKQRPVVSILYGGTATGDTLRLTDADPDKPLEASTTGADLPQFEWSSDKEDFKYNNEINSTISPFGFADVENFGKIKISVTASQDECSSTDSLFVLAAKSTEVLHNIANYITPNNDGHNDIWKIPELNKEEYSKCVIEVFDRWGRMVWRSQPGYTTPWDGRSGAGKELPMDSYHYVIKLNDGKTAPIVGNVTIIR